MRLCFVSITAWPSLAHRGDNFRLQGREEREGREGGEGREGREVSDYVSFLLSCDDCSTVLLTGVKCEVAPVFGVTTREVGSVNISVQSVSVSEYAQLTE